MNVLDLFSGIGGFSLGLERAGMRTVAFCEIEPYCRAVLRKHWANVPIYDDIRSLTKDNLTQHGIGSVDVVCGGFPCQDISVAGDGAGIDGERSGLWKEYARIIGSLRPHYVIVENVAALLVRGLGKLLADLASVGYDSEWHCIPAAAVKAPHNRDRIWVVAYPRHSRLRERGKRGDVGEEMQNLGRIQRHGLPLRDEEKTPVLDEATFRTIREWAIEPCVDRVANGIPRRVDRLRGLGNAIVPQIAEIIGKAIMRDAR